MRKSALLGMLVVLLAALTVGRVPVALSQAQPAKISIPAPVFDFGTVSEGSKVVHDFVIRNIGGTSLAIQRVVAACGCTASASSQDFIDPGKEATIHVEFDTTGFSGEKLKTIRLYSSDMDNPSTVLTLKGVVEPHVVVEPKRVLFGDIVRGSGASATAEVSVKVRPGTKTTITGVRGFSQYVRVEEIVASPKERRIKLTVDPKAPLGELRDRVVVSLSGARESTINIPLFAVVKGTMQFQPSVVSFGVMEGRAAIERTVKLENRGKAPVTIADVTSSHPAISTSLKEITPGKSYVLRLVVDPTKVKNDLRGTIEVTTNNPDEAVLSLSVYGTLPPKV